MGSKGSKPRKKSHSGSHSQSHPQHLPKVGTPQNIEHEQHLEREAVLDNMGLGGASSTTRIILGVVIVLVVIGAVFALIGINAAVH
jgi:hypothetical protein